MFIKNAIFFSLPDIINIMLRFLVSIFVAKILGPENLGIYSVVALTFLYLNMLNIGMTDGMGLKIYALYRKSSNYLKLKQIYMSVAYTYINIILFIASIFVIAILNIFYELEAIVWFGVIIHIVIVFIYQYSLYAQASGCFEYQYKKFAVLQIVNYLFNAVITVLFVYYYALFGLFLSLLLGSIFNFLFLRYFLSPNLKLVFSVKIVKEIIILGFPMYITGSLLSLIQSINKWFIIYDLNTTQLGLFTIVLSFSGILLVGLIKVLGIVLQYGRQYFARVKSKTNLIIAFKQIVILFLIIHMVLITATQEIVFYLFDIYLIKYISSFPLVIIMFMSSFFLGIYNIISTYFNIIGKRKYMVISGLVSIIFALFFHSVAVLYYNSLLSIAYATLFSMMSMSFIIIYFFTKKNIDYKFIFLLILFFACFMLYLFLKPAHIFNQSFIFNAMITLKIIIYMFVSISPMLLYFYKNNNIATLKKVLSK